MGSSEFDQYATNYEAALQQGLSVSGESADHFARRRVEWLSFRLNQMAPAMAIQRAMDFGCGTGNSVGHLQSILQAEHVVGIDASVQSLVQARERYSEAQATFFTSEEYPTKEAIDLAYCNGVFHHIPIAIRPQVMRYIFDAIKPDGIFAFWENNPWNPGTRIVMSRIPFDRDAITLSIPTAKRMLIDSGFSIERVDSCFYFPKMLAWLRWLEPSLARFPLGAQYLIVARKKVL